MKSVQPIPILLAQPSILEVREALSTVPLKDVGTTFSMAQETRWLDDRSFAIGRWDGSLTIFHRPDGAEGSPVISTAIVSPSWAGLEMITRLSSHIFATSNDRSSVALWTAPDGFEKGVRLQGILKYDPAFGVANDGTVTSIAGQSLFVSGHSEGYLLVWQLANRADQSRLLKSVDLRSTNPVPSPYRLWNIRSVEAWRPGLVITGSEDGDVCIVAVPDGLVRFRGRYNPAAQRGINDLALYGDYLLLANCSIGSDDRNLWLYHLSGDCSLQLLHSLNLKVDPSLPQVFNFCVEAAQGASALYFFAATQEGIVWIGTIAHDRLIPLGTQPVSTGLGAALSFRSTTRLLTVVGDNIHLFEVL